MKTIISLCLTALILFSLGSCNRKTILYLDDLDCTTLSDQALGEIDESHSYATADEYFLTDYFAIPMYVTDSVIRFASNSSNLNEIGIFHTTDGNAAEMANLLKAYLMQSYEKNHTWYNSYIPTETPKLRDAEIRIYGNYVVYAILSKDSKNAFFTLVENQLRYA